MLVAKAIWPYNLLDEVVGDESNGYCWQDELSEDQEAGLEYAVSKLSETEQKIVLLYYKGETTLEVVASEIGVSRARIQQITKKVVQKLRHPVLLKRIKFGYQGYEDYRKAHLDIQMLMAEIERKQYRVDEQRKRLEKEEKALSILESNIHERESKLGNHVNATYLEKYITSAKESSLDDFNFSKRTYNALRRAHCNNLADVIDLAERNILDSVKQIGTKGMQEVLSIILKTTGNDYFQKYGVDKEYVG